MSYSEIVLSPNSGRPITLALKDKSGQPVDFTIGTWTARIIITEYPMYVGVPFATLITPSVVVASGPSYEWLTLGADSVLTLTPSPIVTVEWRFSRQHYDCFIAGPNANSALDRVAHGPLKMDW